MRPQTSSTDQHKKCKKPTGYLCSVITNAGALIKHITIGGQPNNALTRGGGATPDLYHTAGINIMNLLQIDEDKAQIQAVQ